MKCPSCEATIPPHIVAYNKRQGYKKPMCVHCLRIAGGDGKSRIVYKERK